MTCAPFDIVAKLARRGARLAAGAVVFLAAAAWAQQPVSLEQVAAVADPAVGRVVAIEQKTVSSGSGFILGAAPDGSGWLFLTNHHVIGAAQKLLVGFHQDGQVFVYKARVVTSSPGLDLAVLHLAKDRENAAHRARALALRRPLARKGEGVVALGFPGTADYLGTTAEDVDFFVSTLTGGTASKIIHGNWQEDDSGPRFDIVQHTASINPGNSGGPLLDLCAQMIGLNTMIAIKSGAGSAANDTYWAVSAPVAMDFLDAERIGYTRAATDCQTPGASAAPPAVQAPPSPGPGTPQQTLPPPPAVADVAWRLPTWAVAAISLGLAFLVIGGAVLASSRHKRPAGRPGATAATPGPAAPLVTLEFGSGARRALGQAALARGLRIGRGAEADIRQDGPGISRLHALIRLEGRRLMLTDLGSTNGTRVDGKPIPAHQAVQITSASVIVLGSEPLRIARHEAKG